jgi:hypothetical protein
MGAGICISALLFLILMLGGCFLPVILRELQTIGTKCDGLQEKYMDHLTNLQKVQRDHISTLYQLHICQHEKDHLFPDHVTEIYGADDPNHYTDDL